MRDPGDVHRQSSYWCAAIKTTAASFHFQPVKQYSTYGINAQLRIGTECLNEKCWQVGAFVVSNPFVSKQRSVLMVLKFLRR